MHIVFYDLTRNGRLIHCSRVVNFTSGLLNERLLGELEAYLVIGLKDAQAKVMGWDVLLAAKDHPPVRGAYHYYVSFVVIKEDDTEETHVATVSWPHVIRADSDLRRIQERLLTVHPGAYAALKSCKSLR